MKTLFWVAVNLIGFIILIYIYNNRDKTGAKINPCKKIFGYLQTILMLYLIFDTGMYITNGMVFNGSKFIHYTFSMLCFLFSPLPGLLFLLYCDCKIFNDEKGLRKRNIYYTIPFIVNTIAVILTPFTNILFLIDENNIYKRGEYFWITLITGSAYLVSYLLLTIRTRRKQVITPEGPNIYLYLCPIPPIIFSILQLISYGPLLLGIGFVISAYYLYTNIVQSVEDKRRLFVRFNNINIAHFAVISFLMTIGMLWTYENIINELSQEYININQAKLFLPFVIMTFLFMIFVFSTNRIIHWLIFMPLKLLVDSLIYIRESNGQEIYGLDRNDEIGLLSKTIKDLFVKGHQDGLTGIYNRRYLETTLDKIITTLFRTESCLSILLLDIDYFKKYNDTYGHSRGDDCLKIVAQALNKVITRKGDFIARYGGEEFAVVLPGTDNTGANIIANKMLKTVQELKIPHEKSVNGIVTISIGVTTGFRIHTQSWNNYFKKADEALYMSKNNGRNQITSLALT